MKFHRELMFSEEFSVSVFPLITQYCCVNKAGKRREKLDSIPLLGFDLKQLRSIPFSVSSGGKFSTHIGPLFS